MWQVNGLLRMQLVNTVESNGLPLGYMDFERGIIVSKFQLVKCSDSILLLQLVDTSMIYYIFVFVFSGSDIVASPGNPRNWVRKSLNRMVQGIKTRAN